MEDTEKQEPTQWFVFFKDQLLLKKEKTRKRRNKIQSTLRYRTTVESRYR